jgi:hypothetical protein
MRLLYTSHLRGDLALLPRLYSFIRSLGPRDLLLDAGMACDDSAWHCALTGGRSMLHVLDAMGYDAVNVQAFLSAEGRAKLADQAIALRLIAEGESWGQAGAFMTADTIDDEAYDLHIILAVGEATRIVGRSLHLAALSAGQVGRVVLDGLRIVESDILTMPAATQPDPTIAATVDFVLEEARYVQRRRSGE